MARILLVHRDRKPRKTLEAQTRRRHQVTTATDLAKGIRAIATTKPDLLLVGVTPHKTDAMDLLRHMRRNGVRRPVILIGPAGAGYLQQVGMHFGAAAFLEFPVEQSTLDDAINKALLAARRAAEPKIPPLVPEEESANLTQLEKHLNGQMVCVSGKNQVYLQSLILGAGHKSKPRIALKCPMRKKFGQEPTVYYEFIRDVCCKDPGLCAAHRRFNSSGSA